MRLGNISRLRYNGVAESGDFEEVCYKEGWCVPTCLIRRHSHGMRINGTRATQRAGNSDIPASAGPQPRRKQHRARRTCHYSVLSQSLDVDPLRRWIVLTVGLVVNSAPMNSELSHCSTHMSTVRAAVGCWHTDCSRRVPIKSLSITPSFTRRAAGELAEQGVLDGRPVVALSWGFEATLQTRGCGEL
jgi:hypothetical protein